MSPHADPATLLPHDLPDSEAAQLILYAVRRMAVGGLADAHGANAIMLRFGLGFRRPRLTRDEDRLVAILRLAPLDPPAGHTAMADLLGTARAPAAFSAAHALAQACEDMGRPL